MHYLPLAYWKVIIALRHGKYETCHISMYVVSFGGQKQVLKGKGTIRLNLRDPFWLQRYKGKTQYDVINTKVQNRWDNRQVTTTFTYRFGKNGQQMPRHFVAAVPRRMNKIG